MSANNNPSDELVKIISKNLERRPFVLEVPAEAKPVSKEDAKTLAEIRTDYDRKQQLSGQLEFLSIK
jgi:hypothetical protein